MNNQQAKINKIQKVFLSSGLQERTGLHPGMVEPRISRRELQAPAGRDVKRKERKGCEEISRNYSSQSGQESLRQSQASWVVGLKKHFLLRNKFSCRL